MYLTLKSLTLYNLKYFSVALYFAAYNCSKIISFL
jgi:hypothetical protein